MSAARYGTAALAYLLPCAAAAAQNDFPQEDEARVQRIPRGGERSLRQLFLTLSPETNDDDTTLELTYEPLPMSPTELKRTIAAGERWHFGGRVFPIFETTHPLQFDRIDDPPDMAPRFMLPAGSYVLSIQQGPEGGQFVFTPTSIARGIKADAPNSLIGLGGRYVPAEFYDDEHTSATPRVELEAHDYSGPWGRLIVCVGAFSWGTDFTVLERPKTDVPAVRLDHVRILQDLGVAAPVRRALLHDWQGAEILTLDPESGEDDEDPGSQGDRRGARFRGYRVLGRRALTRPDDAPITRELRSLLLESVFAHPTNTVADCFQPRHGLRLETPDGTVDLVICFACEQTIAWVGNKRVKGCYVAQDFEPRFSQRCRALGLEVAR